MRILALICPALACIASFGTSVTAQSEQPPIQSQPEQLRAKDYGQWESLRSSGTLSPDGKWIAYQVSRSNGDNELRLKRIQGEERESFSFGTSARFSEDSRWLGYLVGMSETQRERLRKAKKPVRNKLVLRDLKTDKTIEIDAVTSFRFSEDGKHIAYQRYKKQDQKKGGADLIVRDLDIGSELCLGNVASYQWSEASNLLAVIIDTQDMVGSSVSMLDADSGNLTVLDSAKARYTGLSWRKNANDLAFLKISKHEPKDDEQPSHVIMALRDLDSGSASLITFDHRGHEGFPAGMRVVSRAPRWHKDGRAVFFGIRPWEVVPSAEHEEATEQEDDKETDADAGPPAKDKDAQSLRDSLEDPAGVDVWHAKDARIIPEQKNQASRDRRKSHLCAFWLANWKFVRLGDDTVDSVSLLENSDTALGLDTDRHEREAMFGPELSDVYVIDTRTGDRTRILERHKFVFGGSPDGKKVLFVRDDTWHAYDVASGTTRPLTAGVNDDFIDDQRGVLTDENRPYGIAGWNKDSSSVFLHSRFDLWEISLRNGNAQRMTSGKQDQIEHRLLDLDPDEQWIDKSKPQYLAVYGERTKRSGFARLEMQEGSLSGTPLTRSQLERLRFEEARSSSLRKAKNADVFAFVEQTVSDSPDIFVAGPQLAEPRQVSKTNPQQSEFAWAGKAELIDYQSRRGTKLQGALYYPANYKPGEQHPMIVYIYEKRSQNLHSYTAPTERHPYNPSVFTSLGYFVYQPDIVYRAQNPGLSALDCVVPAVQAVIDNGEVDPDKVGLVGHSWGAYQTAFIVTRSNLFAAGVAGAPLTNMMSMSTGVYWNSGGTNARIFHESQGRMDKPFWQDVETYIANSPIFGMDSLETPLLIAFGDKDGAVDWHQGVEMYNAARLAAKQLVMLVYDGENHSLRKKPNQVDYHWRVREWFGHYVNGEPAAKWITDGKSFLEREKEIKEKKRAKKRSKDPVKLDGGKGVPGTKRKGQSRIF